MPGIMLGNLYVKDIEERLGISLSDEDKKFLESTHQNNATVTKENKWHCFDMPFVITVSNDKFARKIANILKPYEEEMKGQIRIEIHKQK